MKNAAAFFKDHWLYLVLIMTKFIRLRRLTIKKFDAKINFNFLNVLIKINVQCKFNFLFSFNLSFKKNQIKRKPNPSQSWPFNETNQNVMLLCWFRFLWSIYWKFALFGFLFLYPNSVNKQPKRNGLSIFC